MKKTLLALVAFAALSIFSQADAAPINCQVYATQPAATFFGVGATPVVPCDRKGAVWANTPAAAGGTSSNFGAAFPTAGTAAGFSDGTNMVAGRTAIGLGDNGDGSLLIATAGFVWDGTNFDRLLQPLTNAQLTTAALATAAGQTTMNGNLTATQAPVSANTATATKSQLIGGQYNSTVPTYTDGQQGAFQFGSRGAARVQLMLADSASSATGSTASDGQALTSILRTSAIPQVYNGTNVDMARGAANSLNSTGTGLPVAQSVHQCDDTTPTTITENSFGNTRLGCADHATLVGALTTGTTGGTAVGLIQASASAAVTMSTATTTQFVALAASQKIYVTSYDVIANGTTNVTFVYGTGANCGSGTTSLTGAYPLTAQAGIAKGAGLGPVLVVPAGNALCVTNSQAIAIAGSVSYAQF